MNLAGGEEDAGRSVRAVAVNDCVLYLPIGMSCFNCEKLWKAVFSR